MADSGKVQYPKCAAILRAKHKGYGIDSLSEKSDEGKIGGDFARSENSLEKVVIELSDSSDVDVNSGSSRYNHRGSEKTNNGNERFLNISKDSDEKGILENGLDISTNKDEVGKSIGREQAEPNSQIGHEKGSKFSGRMSNWQNGERGEIEGFWRRRPLADMEGVRFAATNYPDEVPSNSYSSFSYNYGEPCRNKKDLDGANRVQLLEQDRAELLKKLDELKDQLSQSSEKINNAREKVHPDGRMIPPYPHGYSDTWFLDESSELNRTSGPIYYNHDPFAYTRGHEMAMFNFHPAMHDPNRIPGYGDPFTSQMSRRGSHQLPHQFPQQSLHPYFPGRYVDSYPDSYEPYACNTLRHPPSCSCFHCYGNKRRGSVPPSLAALINSRFPETTMDHMLYHHEMPGAFGPRDHNSRIAMHPENFREKQLDARWPGDFNSEMGGFVQSRLQKVMPARNSRHCRPIAGGSPFVTCCNCFELLKLPKKALGMSKNHQQRVRCGACSSEISFAVINKKLVLSINSEMNGITTIIDDSSNEVENSHVSHSHGHVNRSGANFSSDDYSGYDFLSVDKEPRPLEAVPGLNSNKPQEMQSFHSSPTSSSEDETSSEVIIAPMDATKSIHQPTKASPSPPPSTSPHKEYFDLSNNNNVVSRFGKGNQSGRSEQDKAKIDKITSKQKSLKEVVLATEVDVLDYSNTGVSQDSVDASREHDHPRSYKGGESFLSNIMKKAFRDLSQSNQTDDHDKSNVTVNGQPLSDRVIKKAEKLAGRIRPGNYWYDFEAGFWGVMGGPCLGIIPPFIEEFNYPMPDKCAGGNTGVFVNGRELHQKDLDMLAGRGLPLDSDRYYIIEISGRVVDEDTGEELDGLGKLAPTVDKAKRGFGMKVPRAAA